MKALTILEQQATSDEALRAVKRIRGIIWAMGIGLALMTVACIILAYTLHAEKTSSSSASREQTLDQDQNTDILPADDGNSTVLSAEGAEFDFSDFTVAGNLAFYATVDETEYLMICDNITVDIVSEPADHGEEEYTLLRDESGQPSGVVSVYYDQLGDGNAVCVFKQYQISSSTSELVFNIPIVMRYKCTNSFQYDMPTSDLQHIALD